MSVYDHETRLFLERGKVTHLQIKEQLFHSGTPQKMVACLQYPVGHSARDTCAGRNIHHGAQCRDIWVNLLGYRSRVACSCSTAPELSSSEKCQGLLAYRLCLASGGTVLLDESWLLCSSHAPCCCYDHIRMGEVDAGVLIATVWAVRFL